MAVVRLVNSAGNSHLPALREHCGEASCSSASHICPTEPVVVLRSACALNESLSVKHLMLYHLVAHAHGQDTGWLSMLHALRLVDL